MKRQRQDRKAKRVCLFVLVVVVFYKKKQKRGQQEGKTMTKRTKIDIFFFL